MSEENVMKIIDGVPYYNYDYIGFLYNKLEEKDKDIKRLEKKLKDNIRFDECRFKELFEVKNQLQQKENIIKEVREYIEQLLEYKKDKEVSLEYIERIIDIINQDKRY